jgi:DNA-binding transcriptional LysR family regulator
LDFDFSHDYYVGMNLRSLKYFVAAAELESFNKAADQLHVVQSTLSHQIKNLEEELKLILFERIGKTVKLSKYGHIFLEEAKNILHTVDQATEKMALAAAGRVGQLAVGLQNVGVINNIVSETISRFREKYPQVQLQLAPLSASTQIEKIISGELDAGFFHLPKDYDELASIPIYETDWSLAIPAAHSLAKKRKLYLKDLKNEDFIFFPRSVAPVLVDRIMAVCYEGGLTPNITQEIHEERVMLNLVSVGMGLAFFLNSADNIYKDRVIFKNIEDFSLPVTQTFSWKKGCQSPSLKKLITEVKATIIDLT